MLRLLRQLHDEQSGSVFIETALLIIAIAFAVAPFMMDLGGTLGNKVQEINTHVEQVGQ